MKKSVTILGSTGSIGRQTLEVLSLHPENYRIEALAAYQNIDLMVQQCRQYQPKKVVIVDEKAAQLLRERLKKDFPKIAVLSGAAALSEIAADPDAEIIVAGIVGSAGLASTMSAIRAGKRILFANKEPLVMAGALFMDAVKHYGATLLAVDSEHNAVNQCLPMGFLPGQSLNNSVRSIILTASGGPFRETPLELFEKITPEQAIKHPNWSMGPKISVDSATMMNKGLEVIEAHWLFNLPMQQIEVVIHPQSIVHSLVRYCDGSTLAQLSYPDMRTPIANALAWPNRIEAGVADLDITAISNLAFLPVDFHRYPCLRLAYQAIDAPDSAKTVLNAANEMAVSAFLQRQIAYLEIAEIVADTLDRYTHHALQSLEQVQETDQQARLIAANAINSRIFA